MILYTSAKLSKSAWGWLGVSVFCLAFYLVYNQFSHGVHSLYMTFLFGWPFVLGFIPAFCISMGLLPKAGENIGTLYGSAVAAITVSSLLRGIFDIAGTYSDYQVYLMIFGGILLVISLLLYLYRATLKKPVF